VLCFQAPQVLFLLTPLGTSVPIYPETSTLPIYAAGFTNHCIGFLSGCHTYVGFCCSRKVEKYCYRVRKNLLFCRVTNFEYVFGVELHPGAVYFLCHWYFVCCNKRFHAACGICVISDYYNLCAGVMHEKQSSWAGDAVNFKLYRGFSWMCHLCSFKCICDEYWIWLILACIYVCMCELYILV